jgi:hypothetical protein
VQCGVLFLDGLQLAEQAVVFLVREHRLIEDVILVLRAGEHSPELGGAL